MNHLCVNTEHSGPGIEDLEETQLTTLSGTKTPADATVGKGHPPCCDAIGIRTLPARCSCFGVGSIAMTRPTGPLKGSTGPLVQSLAT